MEVQGTHYLDDLGKVRDIQYLVISGACIHVKVVFLETCVGSLEFCMLQRPSFKTVRVLVLLFICNDLDKNLSLLFVGQI